MQIKTTVQKINWNLFGTCVVTTAAAAAAATLDDQVHITTHTTKLFVIVASEASDLYEMPFILYLSDLIHISV